MRPDSKAESIRDGAGSGVYDYLCGIEGSSVLSWAIEEGVRRWLDENSDAVLAALIRQKEASKPDVTSRRDTHPLNLPPLVPIEEVSKHLGVSRSRVYELVDNGELKRVHIGRRALISGESIAVFLNKVLDA